MGECQQGGRMRLTTDEPCSGGLIYVEVEGVPGGVGE